ncbi:hypothetical protein FRAHR75_940020 [Frankia sp. Hr75.2]|nr:hypothetical protein FRAHR75_940020 [Frankia sp. Hr75.2]
MLKPLADGAYLSVVIDPEIRGKAREKLLAAAAEGRVLDRAKARYVRVVEYDVPDREGNGGRELFALLTNILAPEQAPAAALAGLYQWRWEHEECFQQAKQTCGLDDYQVRSWRAWYAHITLSMLAYAALAAARADQVKGDLCPPAWA